MATAKEWMSKESDSLPEEKIAAAADTPPEGRIVAVEERIDAAMWESIFWVLAESMMKRDIKSALIPS